MSKKTVRPATRILMKVECSMPPEIHNEKLDAWARHPHGFVVVKNNKYVTVKDAIASTDTVRVVHAPSGGKALMRELEEIREEYDLNPNGFYPRLVIVPEGVEKYPAWSQFSQRAALIVEV